MSLCRWSNSCWYIFETFPDEDGKEIIEICGFGQFTSEDILTDWRSINQRAKDHGYNLLERIELAVWLKPWAKMKAGIVPYKKYRTMLSATRVFTYVRTYIITEDMDKKTKYLSYTKGEFYNVMKDLFCKEPTKEEIKLKLEEMRKELAILRKKNA